MSTVVDKWISGSALDTPLGSSGRPPAPARRRSWRLGALLSGPPSPSSETADRWLIQLRWLALAGMAATVVMARLLVPGLAVAPLVAVLGAVLFSNVGWTLAVRLGARRYVPAQITLDALLLAGLLWCSGGLENPFAVFLAFQIALAGFLCSGRTTAGIALCSVGAAVVLGWAPRLPLETAPLGPTRLHTLGALGSIASLMGFLGYFSFVYTRRIEALRSERARNEKLTMLGRLVGGMSHELSTPLATILLGGNELAEMSRGGDPEVARLARTIADEARRASDIIGLLRGHIRPDQRAARVDLAALVSAYAERELNRLGFKGERVFTVPESVPATVLEVALCQVLTNLLSNAAHAEPRRIEIAVIARDDLAEVSVTDDGPGFSAAILERLGEPFQTTKEAGGGMGLGLYVSSQLARRMRAVLRVESGEEGGARVTLVLPLEAGEERVGGSP